jgi:hypothetical protein
MPTGVGCSPRWCHRLALELLRQRRLEGLELRDDGDLVVAQAQASRHVAGIDPSPVGHASDALATLADMERRGVDDGQQLRPGFPGQLGRLVEQASSQISRPTLMPSTWNTRVPRPA